MGRNRACPACFQGGASRPERQVRKEGVYAIIRRQAENEGAGERQSFVVAEKKGSEALLEDSLHGGCFDGSRGFIPCTGQACVEVRANY